MTPLAGAEAEVEEVSDVEEAGWDVVDSAVWEVEWEVDLGAVECFRDFAFIVIRFDSCLCDCYRIVIHATSHAAHHYTTHEQTKCERETKSMINDDLRMQAYFFPSSTPQSKSSSLVFFLTNSIPFEPKLIPSPISPPGSSESINEYPLDAVGTAEETEVAGA